MPVSVAAVCPSCGSEDCRTVGPIPGSDIFAGRKLEAPIAGGALVKCITCGLRFRYPRLPKAQLDALYTAGSACAWTAPPETRVDWNLARGIIEQTFQTGTVLDLGCFTGAFLNVLGSNYERFGIEIHPEAVAIAQSQGIEIVGSDFTQLKALGRRFDAITAFDVIEHVEDPAALLTTAAASLNPQGRLIVSTGDPESRSWRMAKGRYWYCAIPEHISFVSTGWFERTTERTGLKVVNVLQFSRRQGGLVKSSGEALINLLYLYAPLVVRRLRRLGFGGKDVGAHPELLDFPPAWMTARDHILVVLARAH